MSEMLEKARKYEDEQGKQIKSRRQTGFSCESICRMDE